MKKKGFTLIELIVVMVIIAILVLLASPKYREYVSEARQTKFTVEVKELENASATYYMKNNDWPRLSNTPYTSEQLVSYAEDIYDKTGKEIVLDTEGSYYDIDYDKLKNYIKEPLGSEKYILQNPVGNIYYLDRLTEVGKQVIVPKEAVVDNPNSITKVPLGAKVKFAGMDWVMINPENGKLLLVNNDGNRVWNATLNNDYSISTIRVYLNNETSGFLSKIPVEKRGYIADATWYCGPHYNETVLSVQDKVGLIRYSEANLLTGTVLPQSGVGYHWWTITTTDMPGNAAWHVGAMGSIYGNGTTGALGVRPSLNLKADTEAILDVNGIYVVN